MQVDIGILQHRKSIQVVVAYPAFRSRRNSVEYALTAHGIHIILSAHTILIPPHPGVLSALGMILADVVKDYSQTVMLAAGDAEGAMLETLFVRAAVRVVGPGSIERSLGKARRVVDRRELG